MNRASLKTYSEITMNKELILKFSSPDISILSKVKENPLILYLLWEGQMKIETKKVPKEEKDFYGEVEQYYIATVEVHCPTGGKSTLVLPIQENQLIQFAHEVLQHFQKDR